MASDPLSEVEQEQADRIRRQLAIEIALEMWAEQGGHPSWTDMTEAEMIEFIDHYCQRASDEQVEP